LYGNYIQNHYIVANHIMSVQVTVICTCYNQQPFVKACLQSVVNQTYRNIQLIVIDNASTDESSWEIKEFMRDYPEVIFIPNINNIGLCAAFNKGLEKTTGKYVIDLAADDILLPNRVERQVDEFEKLPNDYAVVFSNAQYIDEKNESIGFHYLLDKQNRDAIPTGNVYKEILRRYFICTPTIMIRKSVLFKMGGYDENLSYEDFDFFVRSAHDYKYHYIDAVLTQKRIVKESLGTHFYKVGNTMLGSSWSVCNKAYDLNHSQEEFDLLANRIRGFIKKCFVAEDPDSALKFRKLLNYIEKPGWKIDALVFLCRLRLPINWLYQYYAQWQLNKNMLLMQQGMPYVQLND
jgi:glycosyltransferase involved in cell wall biosynthesis